MRVLKNNKLFIALFFGGIIIPTAILAILSFRNIQNEKVLAEKKLEDSQTSFQKQVADAVKTEQNAILQETKTASQFLYEQPQKLLEFGNAVSFKNVKGVSAIFLFNGNKLIYPSIPIQNNISSNEISTVLTNPIEKELLSEELAGRNLDKIAFARSALLLRSGFSSKEDKIFNLLGLIRFYYNKKQYTEALKIIDILERHPESKGYLQANLTGSLKLLKFEILVAQNRHSEAETYCLSQLSFFLDGHENQNLGSAKFFFDNTISKILSFEDLPRNMREAFWNLRENLNSQLDHS